MLIDFGYPLRTLKGALLLHQGENDERVPILLADVASTALLAADPQDRSVESKAKLYALAIRVCNGGEVEIKAALIKEKVAATYAPIIAGQVFEIMDNGCPPRRTA